MKISIDSFVRGLNSHFTVAQFPIKNIKITWFPSNAGNSAISLNNLVTNVLLTHIWNFHRRFGRRTGWQFQLASLHWRLLWLAEQEGRLVLKQLRNEPGGRGRVQPVKEQLPVTIQKIFDA